MSPPRRPARTVTTALPTHSPAVGDRSPARIHWSRPATVGLAASLLAAFAVLYFRALLFDHNLHVVVPGEVYRSAQPDADLPHLAERLHLRSIINLRGDDEDWEWFRAERAAAEQCRLELYSMHLRADRLPGAQQLRKLIDLLIDCPKPVLIHCHRGIDRAGLASALVQLLGGGSIDDARGQYRLKHGYVAALAQSDVPQVLDLYSDWLDQGGNIHTPDRLREWAQRHYVPYGYRAQIEAIELPDQVLAAQPAPLRFRVTNRSADPWHLRSERARGVHLGIKLHAVDAPSDFTTEARGEYLDRIVAPGDSVVIGAVLPPLPAAGRYRLTVDMVDESVLWFADMGSPPLVADVLARPVSQARAVGRVK